MQTVLISLCGKSPAVITETIYALSEEKPPVFPDRIVIITTAESRKCLIENLFRNGIWAALKKKLSAPERSLKLGISNDCIKVIPTLDFSGDLEDIVSSEDNEAAANFILEVLRQFTEHPDIKIIFSIAGGRKTMSTLAALCMTLLGRKSDRLCHVLVNSPFDNPALSPPFFFPVSAKYLRKTPDGKNVKDADARITLSEIPYVRLRYLFKKNFNKLPGSYIDLVNEYNCEVSAMADIQPELTLEPRNSECFIDGERVKLSKPETLLYWFLLWRKKLDKETQNGISCSFTDGFESFLKLLPSYYSDYAKNKTDKENIRKLVHCIKKKIRGVDIPAKKLRWCIPERTALGYEVALTSQYIYCPPPANTPGQI